MQTTGCRFRGRGAVSRVLRCRRGTMPLEFALVSMPFLLLVSGIVEASWQYTTAAALDRAALRASRFGITGQARQAGAPAQITCRSQYIPWMITASSGGFLRSDRLIVNLAAVSSLSGLGGSATAGAGSGGQVVTYEIIYRQPFITPNLLGAFGATDHLEHRAAIVVKNEPFENAVC